MRWRWIVPTGAPLTAGAVARPVMAAPVAESRYRPAGAGSGNEGGSEMRYLIERSRYWVDSGWSSKARHQTAKGGVTKRYTPAAA